MRNLAVLVVLFGGLAAVWAFSETASDPREVGRYQLAVATLSEPDKSEPIHKILKIDTVSGEVWELRTMSFPITVKGEPGELAIQGWSPIPESFRDQIEETRPVWEDKKPNDSRGPAN